MTSTEFINAVCSLSPSISKMGMVGLKLPKDILAVFDSMEILVLRFYKKYHNLQDSDIKLIDSTIKQLTTTQVSLFANAFETAILMSMPKEKK